MTERLNRLHRWLRDTLALEDYSLAPASGDASFRRYFRVQHEGSSYVLMDAPPEKENCDAFVDVTERLTSSGVNVPEIFARDVENGFLLLSDLGDELYLDRLNLENVDTLYADAISALLRMQEQAPTRGLPDYTKSLLLQEMQLFPDWLLTQHLQVDLNTNDIQQLQTLFNSLADSALAQQQVFVHRDFHSRNLIINDNNPGIIDYQDAVRGPLSYDLVSLLKDCYIKWPAEKIDQWLRHYHTALLGRNIVVSDIGSFRREFDLMGVQRHLKASGIFARLYHRDGKGGYLADIPRTLSYITALGEDYVELEWLIHLLQQRVLPGMMEK